MTLDSQVPVPSFPISALFFLALASSAAASPLPTRDQNPLLAGFGLPMPLSARAPEHDWSIGAALNWGSTALIQRSNDELLVVDAESRELRLSLERRIGERWSVELQLPHRYTGGGDLDGFIDSWHDAFSLAEGARPQQPKDRLRVQYSRNGTMEFDFPDGVNGLGDASLTFAYRLLDTANSALRAGMSVKLPTGEDHPFSSSGEIDASAILSGQRKLGERLSLYGQVAATHLGDGDLLPAQQRSFVWSGHAGISWRALRAVELTMQFDAHTRVFERSELDLFRDALALTVGGTIHLSSGWAVNLGVSEDIEIERSPDVVFVLGLASPTTTR